MTSKLTDVYSIFKQYLLDKKEITDAVGKRIFTISEEASISEFNKSCIYFGKLGSDRHINFQNMETARMVVKAYATTPKASLELAQVVDNAIINDYTVAVTLGTEQHMVMSVSSVTGSITLKDPDTSKSYVTQSIYDVVIR